MKILLSNPACKSEINGKTEKFFVKAGSRWPYSEISEKVEGHRTTGTFPFFMAYTAAILLEEKHNVLVIDGCACNYSNDIFMEKVLEFDPDIHIMECTTPTITNDLTVANSLQKKSRGKIILTGVHLTLFAQDLLKENPLIDFAVKGEYELVCKELVKSIESGVGEGYSHIKGLVYRDTFTGDVIDNGHSEMIHDLNILPMPAFKLFPTNGSTDLDCYVGSPIIQHFPTMTLHASRGCPAHCDYCIFPQVLFGNHRYRKFSPERVVDEMEYLVREFKIKEIYFDDDAFNINKAHVKEICDEIIRRGLDVKWSAMCVAFGTTEEMFEQMARAGCVGVTVGVESGSEQILKNIRKPLKLDQVRNAVNWCVDRGIRTHGTFSFGLDGDTVDTMEATLKFAKELEFDSVQFSRTTPFPGTSYWDKLEAEGRVKFNEWSDFDGKNRSVVNNKFVTHDEIEAIADIALREWFKYRIMRPKWVFRQIKLFLKSDRSTMFFYWKNLLHILISKIIKQKIIRE